MKVTTAEFLKNFGTLADKALKEPITITKHGRDRFVMVEAAAFELLKESAAGQGFSEDAAPPPAPQKPLKAKRIRELFGKAGWDAGDEYKSERKRE